MGSTRVLVCGYYGFGNAGDEAILSVLIDDLRRVDPAAVTTVLGGSVEDLVADHGVEAIHWRDVEATINAARRADLMVLGGGGLFQDHYPFDPDRMWTPDHGDIGFWSGFALLAHATDTPLAIYGVGVGPLTTEAGRRYTSMAFSIARAASVRDQASASVLRELGLENGHLLVTADAAFDLEPATAAVAEEILLAEGVIGDSLIGVCLRPWGDDQWLPDVAKALDELTERLTAHVVLIPFQDSPWRHESDSQVAFELLSRVKHPDRTTILQGGYTPAERAAVLGRCRLVLGMRLHSVIFAATTGVPVVALAYDPKVSQVMNELGLSEAVVDVHLLSSQRLYAAALALDDRRADVKESLSAVVAKIRNRATGNKEVLQRAMGNAVDALQSEADREIRRLAMLRAEDAAEAGDLRVRLALMENEMEALSTSRDVLATEYQTVIGSRALRLVNSYWSFRNRLRDIQLPGRKQETRNKELHQLNQLRVKFSKQLDEILEVHRQVPGVVVYPHTIGWSVSLFQRPQQMALAFARQGYLTLYNVEWMGTDYVHGFSQVGERTYLFAMPDEILDLMSALHTPLVVSYVYNFGWRRFLRDPVTIFEHIDELEVFTATHSMERLTGWYQDAVRHADVAAASAVDLLASLRRDRPDAILCPNGVDYRHFAGVNPSEPPTDLKEVVDLGRPIVGYYGALAEWLDYELVDHAARALPDYEFVFIGPDYDGSMHAKPVFELPNVRWLGVKRYAELPAYLHYFDVATVPFVVSEVTHSVSPLKLFEYMAGGRPVVTPALRECASYPAVLTANDPDHYVTRLKEATGLRHDPEHRSLLRRTARANTWDRRVGTLLDAVARIRKA